MGTKLLITNLPLGFSSGDLEDMFTVVGDVRTATVDREDGTDISRGIGHVEMMSEREAQEGIERFHGQIKSGHRLAVREDKPHIAVKSPPKPKRRPIIRNEKFVISSKQAATKLKI